MSQSSETPKTCLADPRRTFEGRRILVIGGLGFIGSNLAHRLVGLGAHVTLVDSMNPLYGGNLQNIAGLEGRVTVNISDVRDRHSLSYLVRDMDHIFSLAGQTSHMDSMADPFTDLEINATAQLSLLEICRTYAPETRLVFASTRQIYGRPQYLPVDEKHPIHPVDVNGINKMAGEFYYRLYDDVYGLTSKVLRLTNTYGPRMRIKDARQTFLGIWFRRVLEGETFEVWGGQQKRDYTYVDDAVDALLAAAADDSCRGEALNIGGHEVLSLLDSARILEEVAGAKNAFVVRSYPEDRKKIDIGDYYSDYSSFTAHTGWRPSVDFAEGVRRTLAYYAEKFPLYL
ncbi:NAD-dependent epimerase/dehydratase family protein [Rhodospirillum sp. A1_3_36]|uniref:NAD-dependent epimerase/dehydratase family protein n=1 Tax=Rhodospirillum sp. A1_3_36 TaxID=3391666 RepID=UPI0039A772E8